MPTLDAARFRDAEKYAAYLNTVAGRLRSDLAWENLRNSLPAKCSGLRALDLGGGTGIVSLRLAQMQFDVVLLDSSGEMLRIARKDAEESGVTAKIAFCQAEASQLHTFFETDPFDVVVCHNLLEYVADPGAILPGITQVIRKGAAVSVLVRNRAGEVLRAAIKSGDWGLAKTNLSAETVMESLFGESVRIFDRTELVHMFTQAGLEVFAEYGVRVFSDYMILEKIGTEKYAQLLDLESTLGAKSEFAAIARYSHFLLRRTNAHQGTTK
jgi:S-adenosylmethionine-dependent methyltransferase